jgi:Sigma-70, region 4
LERLERSETTLDQWPPERLVRSEQIAHGIPMARQPLSMRQIKEILRLRYDKHLSVREIAGSCGLPASTVGDYLQRAQAAGLTWPLPDGLDEEQLLGKLMGSPSQEVPASDASRPLPDWKQVHQELRRKGVTLQLLWEEYRQVYPEG